MKLEKRHLHISLALLAGSILYNVWVYTRPARSENPRVVQAQPVTQAVVATGPSVASADSAAIAAPALVDLKTDPSWARDPFASTRQAPVPQAVATTAATPTTELVVRTILFSPQRSLALVDGRIVKVGDRVGDGFVTEISRDAVVILTPSGERKRLVLWPSTTEEARK